jgi:hypothetical protein
LFYFGHTVKSVLIWLEDEVGWASPILWVCLVQREVEQIHP